MPPGKKYTVKQGDCLSKIGAEHGIYWKTIYNHPENAEFKKKRQNPNLIYPGDIIFIPEKEKKVEDKPDAQKHSFKLKGVPANLKLRLLESYEPYANIEYSLEIDGAVVSEDGAKTDDDGIIEHNIDPKAQEGVLTLGEDNVEFKLRLGGLDPINTPEGVQGRLHNLGHYTGKIDGNLEHASDALRQFQRRFGLKATGKIDDETRNKLEEIHGI